MSRLYERGYVVGLSDAKNGKPQQLPSSRNPSLLADVLLAVLLPPIGIPIAIASQATLATEKYGDEDRGYIAGYAAGLKELRRA